MSVGLGGIFLKEDQQEALKAKLDQWKARERSCIVDYIIDNDLSNNMADDMRAKLALITGGVDFVIIERNKLKELY